MKKVNPQAFEARVKARLAEAATAFNLPGKRTWNATDVQTVERILQEKRNGILQRHQLERENLNKAKPAPTAPVPEIQAWNAQEQQLSLRHQDDLSTFDVQTEALKGRVLALGRRMYAQYGLRHKEYEAAMQAAWSEMEPLIRAEIERQEAVADERAALSGEYARVLTLVRGLKVEADFPAGTFTGWKDAHHQALVVENSVSRGIDPLQRPPVRLRPNRPEPLVPQAERTHKDRWSFFDLAMFLGGIAFGSSLGAAVHGITFDSDGWHFTPAFWVALIIGIVVSLLVGKTILVRCMVARTLDLVDCYPYLKDDPQHQEERAKAKQAAQLALLGLLAIFAIYVAGDSYGWWVAATERNDAVKGDEGATMINPVIAAAAVSFVTCLFTAVKLAGISLAVNAKRILLRDEVRSLTTQYADHVERYNEGLTAYTKELAKAEEWDTLHAEATGNASYRQNQGEGREVTEAIAGYNRQAAELVARDQGHRSVEEIIQDGLAKTTSARESMDRVATEIDETIRDLNALIKSSITKA